MTSITCKDCKYWALNNIDYRGRDFKPCYHPTMCDEDGYGKSPKDGVNCFDGEYDYNCFESGADFGCIHAQKRED